MDDHRCRAAAVRLGSSYVGPRTWDGLVRWVACTVGMLHVLGVLRVVCDAGGGRVEAGTLSFVDDDSHIPERWRLLVGRSDGASVAQQHCSLVAGRQLAARRRRQGVLVTQRCLRVCRCGHHVGASGLAMRRPRTEGAKSAVSCRQSHFCAVVCVVVCLHASCGGTVTCKH